MYTTQYKFFGRMNDPDGHAYMKGICGDEMEFYLTVNNNKIDNVTFFTHGCAHTKICGETAARLVLGKEIEEALGLSPIKIKNEISNLPEDHIHCTILTTITFLKALAEYLHADDHHD